ncbi:Probable choline kinase 2 [Linum grandiflorum]
MGSHKKDDRMPEERIPGEAKEMLKSLASRWEDVTDANALQVIPLKGAMTNEVFQIKWPTKAGELSHKVIVRIYGVGVEVFFDRNDEIRTFEFMSKQGHGPRLIGRFSSGRIEEFIRARTLSAYDLRDKETSLLIAAKMREFHGLEMPGEKVIYLWDRLRNWLKVAKDMCSGDEAKTFRLHEIDDEITFLEKELSIDQYIGFCHNDVQYGNIMIDEETKAVTIIDYEYASYNPVAFDLANHFCEMAADYHTDTPHVMDYSKYPGPEERRRFVTAYMSSSGGKEVEPFLKDVENYTLGSHLFWGLWGIISEHVNKIEFDYSEYAKQRLDQYWVRKSTLFSSSSAKTTITDDAAVTPTAAATVTPTTGDSSTPVIGVIKEGESEVVTEEEEKGVASEESGKAKQQSTQQGVFRKFKRYLGFTNMFRKNTTSGAASATHNNNPPKPPSDHPDAPDVSSKTTHD